MKIYIKMPASIEVQIIDNTYDIKADFEFESYEKEILTYKTNIKAPMLIKNIFINNLRDFIAKCGFDCVASFDKICVDFKNIKNIKKISYKNGEYIVEINSQ
jgi:hypothetical protein